MGFRPILDTLKIYTIKTDINDTRPIRIMKVSELKEAIKNMEDDIELIIVADNAPPWITDFYISEITPSEDDSDE